MIKRLQTAAKGSSTSTHTGNLDKLTVPQSDQDLVNNSSGDTLIDPEDFTPGSTHSMKKLSASKSKTVKATTNISTMDNDVDPAAGYLEEAAAETTNISTMDNDCDPAAGYLTEADLSEENVNEDGDDLDLNTDDEEDEDPDGDEDEDEDGEVTASIDGLQNQQSPQELEAGLDDDQDWDPPPEDLDDSDIESDETEDDELTGTGLVGDEEVDDNPAIAEEAEGEQLPLLDVDGTPDDSIDHVAFASLGTNLMVIRANRVIASMNKRTAIQAKRDDVYLSDQFQEVVASELSKQGLRAGLKTMGFTLATVNVSKAEVINQRVTAQVHKTTAAIRKVASTKEQAFKQSLTIAAVGINRRYFREQENELRASLEASLTQAGVTGAGKILSRAFSEFGPSYAHSIVELANKISDMPQTVRDQYVAALDLTSDDMDLDSAQDEDLDMDVDSGIDEFDGEDEDADFAPTSVTASLSSPGIATNKNTKSRVDARASGYSVTAAAILNGDAPLVMNY